MYAGCGADKARSDLGTGQLLEFGELKRILSATVGNMATHLTALEKAAYIAVTKDFVGKKPRTRIALTSKGRKAFQKHVAYLQEILEGE